MTIDLVHTVQVLDLPERTPWRGYFYFRQNSAYNYGDSAQYLNDWTPGTDGGFSNFATRTAPEGIFSYFLCAVMMLKLGIGSRPNLKASVPWISQKTTGL